MPVFHDMPKLKIEKEKLLKLSRRQNYKLAYIAFLITSCAWAAPEPTFEPIAFQSPEDYDFNFKEAGSYTGISFDESGYLSLSGSPTGIAVFDRSAEGGENGTGGTSGEDRDNEFGDFTVFAEFTAVTCLIQALHMYVIRNSYCCTYR